MSAEGARGNLDGRNRSSSDGNDNRFVWKNGGREYIRDNQGVIWSRVIESNTQSVRDTYNNQDKDKKIVKSQFESFKKNVPILNTSNIVKYKPEVVCYNCGEIGHYKSSCLRMNQSRTNIVEQKLLDKQKEVDDLVGFINSQQTELNSNKRINYPDVQNVNFYERKSDSGSLISSDDEYDKKYKEQVKLQREYMNELNRMGFSGEVSPKKRTNRVIDLEDRSSDKDDADTKPKRNDYSKKLEKIREEIEVKKQKIEYIKAINYLKELDDVIIGLEDKKLGEKKGEVAKSDDNENDSLSSKSKKKKNVSKKEKEDDDNEVVVLNKETNNLEKSPSKNDRVIEKNDSDEDTNNFDEENEKEDKKNEEKEYETIYKDLTELIRSKKEKGKYKDAASWRYIRDYITKILERRNDGDAILKYLCKKLGKKMSSDKAINLEEIAKALLL